MAAAIGRDATFTFAGQTLTVANFNKFLYNEDVAMHEVTGPGYLMKSRVAGTIDAYGLLGGYHDAAGTTPPLPTGVRGTLVMILSSGKSKTLQASLFKLSGSMSSLNGSPVQGWQYSWVANASNSTDTIVTA